MVQTATMVFGQKLTISADSESKANEDDTACSSDKEETISADPLAI